ILDGRAALDLGDGEWDDLLFRRARIASDSGDNVRARVLLDGMSEAGKERTLARRLYADVLGALGEHSMRAQVLEGLAEDASAPLAQALLLVEAAHSRLNAEEIAPAQLLAKRAEAIAPADRSVRVVLADVAFLARAWEDAVAMYSTLLVDATRDEH